jgi:hypothetical protein
MRLVGNFQPEFCLLPHLQEPGGESEIPQPVTKPDGIPENTIIFLQKLGGENGLLHTKPAHGQVLV